MCIFGGVVDKCFIEVDMWVSQSWESERCGLVPFRIGVRGDGCDDAVRRIMEARDGNVPG